MGRPKVTEAQFWAKMDKSGGPDSCWIWQYCALETGYGSHCSKSAHRTAWKYANGPIPDGLQVLHDCPGGDNPLCCNPKHLWLGTEQDNMRDKVEKGRQSKGPEHSKIMKRVAARGEHSARHTLTDAQVLEIRALYKRGVHGCGAHVLGKRFGVAKNTILWIVNRKGWTHI